MNDKEYKKIINNIDTKLSQMTDDERCKYFADLGFVDVQKNIKTNGEKSK